MNEGSDCNVTNFFPGFPFLSEISPFFDLTHNVYLRYNDCSAGERCTTKKKIVKGE